MTNTDRKALWCTLALYVTTAVLVTGPSLVGPSELVPWDVLSAWAPWRPTGVAAPQPHNALIADAAQHMVWYQLHREATASGARPGWSPYLLCGQPLYSGLLYGYRYPLDALRWVAPGQAAAWMFAFHLVLGATFCALLARRFGAGWPGAALAGAVQSLSGPVFLNMTFPTMQGALAWMPGCLLAVRGLFDAAERPGWLPRLGWALFVVLAHALSLLSGHPEIALYTFLFSGALAAGCAAARFRRQSRAARVWPFAALLLSGAVAGWIILPEWPAFMASHRADRSTVQRVRAYGLPAYQATGLLVPGFCGSPVQHRFLNPFSGRMQTPDRHAVSGPIDWGDKNAVERALYLGILPLALLCCAGWGDRERRFFWIALAFCLLMAFGTPLYALFYYGMPFAPQLHSPFRWMIPGALCVAVLAGCGLTRARADATVRRRLAGIGRVLIGLAAASALAVAAVAVLRKPAVLAVTPVYRGAWRVRQVFSGPAEFLAFESGQLLIAAVWIAAAGACCLLLRRRPALAWLAPGLAAADLFAGSAGFFTHAKPDPVRHPPAAIRFLQTQPGLFRIACYGDEKILPPNTAAFFGLYDVRGCASLIHQRYVEFLSRLEPPTDLAFNIVGRFRQPETLASPWLDFLNVEFLFTDRRIDAKGWEPCFDQGVLIYRNRAAFPRYYLAGERPEVFRDGPPLPLDNAPVTVTAYRLDHVALAVESPRAAWLVSSETDLGCWRPWIDGAPAAPEPLLGLFRCVRVPAGRHAVEWRLVQR